MIQLVLSAARRCGQPLAALLMALLLALPGAGLAEEGILLSVTTEAGTTTLDRAALEALPAAEFETTTIWTEGLQHFRGVPMTALLDHLGIHGGTLRLTAANDYSITIPVESFRDGGALLAYQRNHAPMSLRSKGPLWLVYPYDSDPAFRSEMIYSNSIWQLDRLSTAE